jgi:hypothetical protein
VGTVPAERRIGVVVLDYPGPSIPARTKSVLLADERLNCAYPLDACLPCTTSLPGYVGAVADGVDMVPEVVVTYCGAAAIGRELAQVLPALPGMVMINPVQSTAADAVLALAGFRGDSAGHRRSAADWLVDGADHDQALGALTDVHLARLEREFGSPQPHLRPIAVQLATVQLQWVYHIAAAAGSDRNVSTEELHVVSADHRCMLGCAARHEVLGNTIDEVFSGRRLADVIAAIGVGR